MAEKPKTTPQKSLALQFSPFEIVDPFLKKQCLNSSKGSLKGKKEKANSYMFFNGLHICSFLQEPHSYGFTNQKRLKSTATYYCLNNFFITLCCK